MVNTIISNETAKILLKSYITGLHAAGLISGGEAEGLIDILGLAGE